MLVPEEGIEPPWAQGPRDFEPIASELPKLLNLGQVAVIIGIYLYKRRKWKKLLDDDY